MGAAIVYIVLSELLMERKLGTDSDFIRRKQNSVERFAETRSSNLSRWRYIRVVVRDDLMAPNLLCLRASSEAHTGYGD